MSFIGNLFGGGGGNFKAQQADVMQTADPNQIAAAQGQGQSALYQQQALANQLAGQNGIGNQSSVFNQQQALSDQLKAQSMGQGPNPAQAQLAQNTANNVANQAALMAGQRGSGANAGLIARQAGQQGAATQQNSVGQAATLQAQQQIAAQQALGSQLSGMGNLATQQVGQQAQSISGLNQAAQAQQQIQNQNVQAQNNANVANSQQQNSSNAQIQSQVAQQQGGLLGGLIGGAGSALSGGLFAHGGMIKMADGGQVAPVAAPKAGASSKIGQALSSIGQSLGGAPAEQGTYAAGNAIGGGLGAGIGGLASLFANHNTPKVDPFMSSGAAMAQGMGASPMDVNMIQSDYKVNNGLPMSTGGKVPVMLSPGEMYLPPKKAKEVAKGKDSPMSGKKIPGKAKVTGDSEENDIVPAKLEEGGIVIPRSVMNSKDPAKEASKFVAAVMAKQGLKRK